MKRQVEQIIASIREFGFTNPILLDPEGVLIAGAAAEGLIVPAHPIPVKGSAFGLAEDDGQSDRFRARSAGLSNCRRCSCLADCRAAGWRGRGTSLQRSAKRRGAEPSGRSM